MKLPTLYFDWLQDRNPTGGVDRLPELHNRFETSVPGVYCVGDLTGIPLIKLAAESGHDLIEHLHADASFARQRNSRDNDGLYDFVIIGAGPAGMSAAIRAVELQYRVIVIESSRKFNTIANFPAGKPIYVTPVDPPARSAFKFTDGTKETLLRQLAEAAAAIDVPVREDEMATRIKPDAAGFAVETSRSTYRALRVIVAIGKTGNSRTLDVPGATLPKVFTRLIDPGRHHGQEILVVGGGDSAVETAVAIAGSGNRVTLSYRGTALSRPNERNLADFNSLTARGSIAPIFESTVTEIRPDAVVLGTKNGLRTMPNDFVYAMIGTEIPVEFFRRNRIRLQGERALADRLKFATLLFFAAMLYFGKKAPSTPVLDFSGFLSLPARFMAMEWSSAIPGFLAWLAFIGTIVCGAAVAGLLLTRQRNYAVDAWSAVKHGYYTAVFLLFVSLYVACNLRGGAIAGLDTGFWYTAVYSLTIVIFGFRRMHVRPTGYIRRQTLVLMAVQVVALFVLPVLVLPLMGDHGLLGSWVMTNVFPGHSYWRSYGFILAWPLFLYNLATGQPTVFWLITGLVQTFVIIPLIVYRWGKGAYCGWICSCGALAETLGDEYRTGAPHGRTAKSMENVGQFVLWFAAITTIFALNLPLMRSSSLIGHTMLSAYGIVVDIVFAGVLGLGVYFFYSGRIWCRILCPLAALMHLYARFSRYRIMADKKRCISCNICTKVCHMGIDVMGYANKGIPMDDVECVRCSACIVNCPMQVLTFGNVGRPDPGNVAHGTRRFPLTRGWQSGLPERDIHMLIEKERGIREEAK